MWKEKPFHGKLFQEIEKIADEESWIWPPKWNHYKGN